MAGARARTPVSRDFSSFSVGDLAVLWAALHRSTVWDNEKGGSGGFPDAIDLLTENAVLDLEAILNSIEGQLVLRHIRVEGLKIFS